MPDRQSARFQQRPTSPLRSDRADVQAKESAAPLAFVLRRNCPPQRKPLLIRCHADPFTVLLVSRTKLLAPIAMPREPAAESLRSSSTARSPRRTVLFAESVTHRRPRCSSLCQKRLLKRAAGRSHSRCLPGPAAPQRCWSQFVPIGGILRIVLLPLSVT
jgi:hypothetical protein